MYNLWQWMIGLLPFDWAHYGFMQHALLAVLLVSFLYGLLGAMVINQQMAFFSDAIGHAALTGIAIGVLAGLADPLWAMIVFAVLLAVGISLLRRFSQTSTDTTIGLFMSFAVALGVVILSRGGGFARYSSYLIGDVLSITRPEITRLLLLLAGILAFWSVSFNRMMLASLNPSLAHSRGINVALLEVLFSVIVAVLGTVSIQWVGMLVINSLLILPAAAARNLSRNTRQYVWISIVISLLSGILGLLCSYYWATATGATIVLFAMGFYLVSLAGVRR